MPTVASIHVFNNSSAIQGYPRGEGLKNGGCGIKGAGSKGEVMPSIRGDRMSV